MVDQGQEAQLTEEQVEKIMEEGPEGQELCVALAREIREEKKKFPDALLKRIIEARSLPKKLLPLFHRMKDRGDEAEGVTESLKDERGEPVIEDMEKFREIRSQVYTDADDWVELASVEGEQYKVNLKTGEVRGSKDSD